MPQSTTNSIKSRKSICKNCGYGIFKSLCGGWVHVEPRIFSCPVQHAIDYHPHAEPRTEVIKAVIGQYADYYIEWDGMVEKGPGCMERMQARIDALPDGHPSKVRLIPKEDFS